MDEVIHEFLVEAQENMEAIYKNFSVTRRTRKARISLRALFAAFIPSKARRDSSIFPLSRESLTFAKTFCPRFATESSR